MYSTGVTLEEQKRHLRYYRRMVNDLSNEAKVLKAKIKKYNQVYNEGKPRN